MRARAPERLWLRALLALLALLLLPPPLLASPGEEEPVEDPPPPSRPDPPAHGARGHWSYADMAQWASTFPYCGGHMQSPINIETGATVFSPHLEGLLLSGYNLPPEERLRLQNNGHTVVLKLPEGMTLSGGGFPQPYRAVQLHLHWGTGPANPGSEHTVDGHRFAGEIHLVHYNSEFSSFHEAVQEPGGLAVLAAFLQAGAEENEAYQHILESLEDVCEEGQETFIEGFDVAKLLPPDLTRYFHYNGSLTTPPCFQTVNWTVFNQTIQLSQEQVSMLEDTLRGDEDQPLQGNFRLAQSLEGRRVLASFLETQTPEGWHPTDGEGGSSGTLAPHRPLEGRDGSPPAEGGSHSVGSEGTATPEKWAGSSVHLGDILAVLFGILFALNGLAFLLYVLKHKRQKHRSEAPVAKANVIYTPGVPTEEEDA